MSKNIYIGNRYVPKVMGTWDNTKQSVYESLSIVMWEGNSFTSKKSVPTGVDISNTEFWVSTGNYNAQVEIYRQQVVTYKTETDTKIDDILNGMPDIKIDGGIF